MLWTDRASEMPSRQTCATYRHRHTLLHRAIWRGSSRTPRDLAPTAQLLDVIMRRTLLPRMGYHEGLTHIQLWLLYHLVSQTPFDIWDVILLEMEDTLVEGFRGHHQLP